MKASKGITSETEHEKAGRQVATMAHAIEMQIRHAVGRVAVTAGPANIGFPVQLLLELSARCASAAMDLAKGAGELDPKVYETLAPESAKIITVGIGEICKDYVNVTVAERKQ